PLFPYTTLFRSTAPSITKSSLGSSVKIASSPSPSLASFSSSTVSLYTKLSCRLSHNPSLTEPLVNTSIALLVIMKTFLMVYFFLLDTIVYYIVHKVQASSALYALNNVLRRLGTPRNPKPNTLC